MTVIVMAFTSLTFVSCGDDDDDNDAGAGKATVVVDGASYEMNFGWWNVNHKSLGLYFSDTANAYSLTPKEINGKRIKEVELVIYDWNYAEIQPGTYTAFMETSDILYVDISKEDVEEYPYYSGQVLVTITKDADRYTISFPETNVSKYDEETGKNLGTVPFSFSYSGKLSEMHFMDDDD